MGIFIGKEKGRKIQMTIMIKVNLKRIALQKTIIHKSK
jgi:hypothetical protein